MNKIRLIKNVLTQCGDQLYKKKRNLTGDNNYLSLTNIAVHNIIYSRLLVC